jgi:hypothetical protein
MTLSANDPEQASIGTPVEKGEKTDAGKSVNENAIDPHADKYNDPRAKITARGIWLGVGVLLFGIVGAAGSIYQRKTKLEKSRQFWGDDTILALQLAERMKMESVSGKDFDPVELTATPGLGHLRHALLDERSYLWQSIDDQSMISCCESSRADVKSKPEEEQTSCVRLVLTDPTAHRFEPVRLIVDLNDGWVGHEGDNRRVQTTPRVRPALAKFLSMLINVQQKRYDFRD